MSIQEHLNKIKSAIFGKEVRQSIHDAIKQCYDDASEKDNANMEVKIARGTHENLNARLNVTDQKIKNNSLSLEKRINEINTLNDIKVNKTELDVERKRIDNLVKLEEGSTTGDAELIDGRVSIDSYDYDNIGNAIRGQLKPLVEFPKYYNGIKQEELQDDFYIDYGNGNVLPYSSHGKYTASGFIPVIEDKIIYIKGSVGQHFAFYTATKEHIKNGETNNFQSYDGVYKPGDSTGYMTVPKTAKYIRLTLGTSLKKEFSTILLNSKEEISTLEHEFIAPSSILPLGSDHLRNITKELKELQPRVYDTTSLGNNLFNKNTVELNCYINENGDKILNNETYVVSDFIPLKFNSNYISNGQLRFVAYYDSKLNFLKTDSKTNTITIKPEGTKFVRLTLNKSVYTEIMFNEGNKKLPYEEFKYYPIGFSLLQDISEKSKNLFNRDTVLEGHYIDEGGNIIARSDYVASDFIEVDINENYISNGNLRFVSYYDSDYKFLGYDINKKNFTVSKENTKYIRLSISTPTYKEIMFNQGEILLPYEDYGYFPKGSVQLKHDINNLTSRVETLENTLNILNGIQTKSAKVQVGSKLEMNKFPLNLKKSIALNGYCEFDTFKEIIVGKGHNSYRGIGAKVTSTELLIVKYEDGEKVLERTSHSMNISKSLNINIFIDENSKALIELTSFEGSYSFATTKFNYELNGKPFIMSTTDIKDVVLSATSQDFNKEMWLFGDSYFGVSENRVIGHLKSKGYTDVLIDGLAGQSSSGAYEEVKKCLEFGAPKYLVWCLGMNDSNPDDYKRVLDRLISLCKDKNIELILTKIPTVPERDKEQLNKYVTESGKRYIDSYKAVGTNSRGEWYEGYLHSDEIHPTKLGARAIANRIIIDVPEIMVYGGKSIKITGDIEGDH